MASEQHKTFNNLEIRLRKEIIALFEKVMPNNYNSFLNPNLANCWEVLDCKSTDCPLRKNESNAERCWQVAAACCSRKPQGDIFQKYNECCSCKVFKASCPTIVEEIGEYFNNLLFLLYEQQQKILEDKQRISNTHGELNTVLEQLQNQERKIKEIMITDKLTTLFNRHHLVTVLEDEIARCQRFSRPIALIMIDIDDFRSFNESYGHQAGDNMLSFVGTLIKENTRKFDRAFRYGGKEFVVVLPESDLTMAYIVAERIRKGFEINSFPVRKRDSEKHENISRTVSIGLTATFAYGTQSISIFELINQTEKALYQAKGKGGNICIRFN
ncbi:MAG: GGDEF domain-containing protein [Nitrospirae bacterium]|nr:GGDEF domain-containing protein [Nitrospirota bacterium]